MDITGLWRKVPVRDDTDWLMLPYGARGLYLQLWRKLDNDGRLNLGKHGLRGVCGHVGTLADWPVIEPDLKELLDAGEVTFDAGTGHLFVPRFVAAQGAYVMSPEAAKKRGQRARSQGQQGDMSQSRRDESGTCRTELELELELEENKKRTEVEEAKASSFAVGHAPPPPSGTQGALIPDVLPSPKPAPERNRKPRKARAAKDSPETTARTNPVWEAYSAAFVQRHRTEPTRNMRVNVDLGRFIDRVGAADAPAVAAFYVQHPAAFYVGQLHPVWALLKDAEKLHAEWRRGQVQTMTEARQREQTSSNAAFRELERRRLARAAAAEPIALRVEDDNEN